MNIYGLVLSAGSFFFISKETVVWDNLYHLVIDYLHYIAHAYEDWCPDFF